jgi:hypothetical protein
MNRLLFTAASVLLACSVGYSQNTVIDVKPAHDGKNLTMEEAIYKGVGYARTPFYTWWADGSVHEGMPERPAPRYTLFTDQGSLFARDNVREESFVIAPADGPNLVFGETVSRNEFGIDSLLSRNEINHRGTNYRLYVAIKDGKCHFTAAYINPNIKDDEISKILGAYRNPYFPQEFMQHVLSTQLQLKKEAIAAIV